MTDSRRQTGPGRLLDGPGAALEARTAPADRAAALDAWRRRATALCAAVGWEPALGWRLVGEDGLSLALGAPVDALYAATDANEAAWTLALADVSGTGGPGLGETVARLRAAVERERDPVLRRLVEAAEARGVGCLWDDEAVTVGLGAGGQTFPIDALPAVDAVDWRPIASVPTALVTGTNGKSTTVRLLSTMARAAGHTSGVSTTDAVLVGGEVLEEGDFSGPMGARAALRDRRVTLGVLEAARGGLLRRGVPFVGATAAAVTNVAPDHLGDYGVETVEALAEAKFVVAKALRAGGTLVLTADDPVSAAEADRQCEALAARGLRLVWTALDPDHPRLAGADRAAAVVDGAFALRRRGAWHGLLPVEAAPSTLGGAARHNVRNALTALAVGAALGLDDAALAGGLRTFRGDATDNPGRANRFRLPNGARVVVDYAHNAHGIQAVVGLAAGWPARRRALLMSVGGDRSDGDLDAMAEAALPFGADRYLLADLPGYLRGRAPGDAPAVFERVLHARGVPAAVCSSHPSPPDGVRAALSDVRPDDLLLLFVLSHRDVVFDLLREAGAEPEG